MSEELYDLKIEAFKYKETKREGIRKRKKNRCDENKNKKDVEDVPKRGNLSSTESIHRVKKKRKKKGVQLIKTLSHFKNSVWVNKRCRK